MRPSSGRGTSAGKQPYPYSPFFLFAQRAAAALRASAVRRSGVRLALLRLPPRRPRATAAGFLRFRVPAIRISLMHSGMHSQTANSVWRTRSSAAEGLLVKLVPLLVIV